MCRFLGYACLPFGGYRARRAGTRICRYPARFRFPRGLFRCRSPLRNTIALRVAPPPEPILRWNFRVSRAPHLYVAPHRFTARLRGWNASGTWLPGSMPRASPVPEQRSHHGLAPAHTITTLCRTLRFAHATHRAVYAATQTRTGFTLGLLALPNAAPPGIITPAALLPDRCQFSAWSGFL